MNTRALNQLAELICRAQANGARTPMGIAFAIDAAGMLQSPEIAAELEALREQVASLLGERHTTNAALAELTLALRASELDAESGDGSTRTVDEDPIAYALTEKAGALPDPRRIESVRKLRDLLAKQQRQVTA
ncbi:hypothetical protein [Streptomyces sp. NPDC002994]|uniref:hypothetical protein n=1 Tax=Streptomyces sp. NPDC002994 TaxID=3154441 RepID=UPI0033A16637